MPPPWDDDYFFAALPSAPEILGDDTKGDRYGAGSVTETTAESPSDEPAEDTPRPKRKRRRRRRRGGAAKSQSTGSNESPGEESS